MALLRLAQDEAGLRVEHVGVVRLLAGIGRFPDRHCVDGSTASRNHRSPSTPLISSFLRPPTRGRGRPESVTATATTISLARGASATRTSMPSKWLRTKAASLWPNGTSKATPGPPRFFEEGINAAPLPRTFLTGAP